MQSTHREEGLILATLVAVMTTLAGAQALALILIVWAAARSLAGAPPTPRDANGSAWAAALVFVIVPSLICAFHGGWLGFVDALRKTWPILLAPATFVLARGLNDRAFRRIETVLLWSAGVVSVVFLFRWLALEPMMSVKPRQAFHSNPGVSGMILIPATLFLILRARMTPIVAAAWMAMALSIWFLNVRATIVPWFLVSFIGLYRFHGVGRRLAALVLVIPLLLLVWVALYQSTSPLTRWYLFDLENQSAIVHRLLVWSQVIPQFLENPIFGNGFNRFAIDLSVVQPAYHHYLALGVNPHSGYLLVLHATGVVGFFALMGVIGLLFRQVACPAGRWATDRWRVVATLSLLAMMIAALADKMIFVTLVSIQTWLLAGLALSRPVHAAAEEARPDGAEASHA